MTRGRRWHETSGRVAEFVAGAWLGLKGYEVIDRRYRCTVGEIDLVARRWKRLAFVEVKYRRTLTAGLEAITPQARARFVRTAGHWLQNRRDYAGYTCTFDVVVVRPWALPVHVRDAFGG